MSTLIIESDVTKTGRKTLIPNCIKSNREESVFLNDKTKSTDELGSFLKNIARVSVPVGEKMATKLYKKLGRAL